MMEYVIPLLGSFFGGSAFSSWLLPVFCLGFIACVPCIIRQIVRWR